MAASRGHAACEASPRPGKAGSAAAAGLQAPPMSEILLRIQQLRVAFRMGKVNGVLQRAEAVGRGEQGHDSSGRFLRR
jgi:hypothetical protein